jgi:hypothetical protein
MLCYAIFYLYPTRFELLMADFALVVPAAIAVLFLSLFVMWLIMIVLLIILMPSYLLGVLRHAIQHPAIQKIALRLQKGVLKENKVPAPDAVRFTDRAWALLFAARGTHPDPNLSK